MSTTVSYSAQSAEDVSSVFGKAADARLPLWFKPAKLFEAEFDADAYVADLRRFVSVLVLGYNIFFPCDFSKG